MQRAKKIQKKNINTICNIDNRYFFNFLSWLFEVFAQTKLHGLTGWLSNTWLTVRIFDFLEYLKQSWSKKKRPIRWNYTSREIFNRDIEFLFTDEFLLIIIALITMKITRYMMKIDDRYMKIYIGDFVHLLCCSMAINS